MLNDQILGNQKETLQTLEDLRFKYGEIPSNLDHDKLINLLSKRNEAWTSCTDLKSEVNNWLVSEGLISNQILLKIDGSNTELIGITLSYLRNITLILVSDYSLFNDKIVSKDAALKLHQKIQSQNQRPIWIKRFEWEHPKKKLVLQSLILHALGHTQQRIYARETIANTISNSSLKDFFDTSSFYGFRGATNSVCLFDKKTWKPLLAMSFGHPYYGKTKYGNRSVECIRAATLPRISVIGGMSKLMKYYLHEYGNTFDTIVYYVDDAHYDSGSMSALGFNFSHFSGPGTHNVFTANGKMMMRTPSMHKEIMWFIKMGEIVAVPDVGNSTFILTK